MRTARAVFPPRTIATMFATTALFAATAVVAVVAGTSIGAAVARVLHTRGPAEPLAPIMEVDDTADERTGTWTEPGLGAPVLGNELIGNEVAAERATSVLTPGDAPVPGAPPEAGLLGRLTDARIDGGDRDAFYLAVEANRRAESGTGGARFSTLRTTAGADHRASFGVAQLTIRAHLAQLERLDESDLRDLAIERGEVERMQRQGDAAIAWYHVIVDGRHGEASVAVLGIGTDEARRVRDLALRGDLATLVARAGARFASSTGLPRHALGELAETLVIRRRDVRDAFARRYQADHHAPFVPGDRDAERMGATVRGLARGRADIGALIARLGGDRAAEVSIAHYLGVGDVAENLYGWHARAASAAVGRARFVRILEIADPISTRLTELSSFESAVAAVAGARDVSGMERARMLTRIARCFHGAPGRARRAFFFDDDPRRPRATTAAELEAGIQEYRAGRAWSDDRVQSAFDELARERDVR